MTDFTNVTIFIKPNSVDAINAAKSVVSALNRMKVKCYLSGVIPKKHSLKITEVSRDEIVEENAIAIAIGGDGTYLNAARELFGKKIPLMGINLGRLGFLAEFENSEKSIKKASKESHVVVRPYFEATITRNGKEIGKTEPFLNDAVIQRNADEKMVSYSISSDGKLISNTRADGLIVSTPTGSTAYNLSTGGPIVHPELDALVLSPICPHTLSFRPVVLPPNTLQITLNCQTASLSFDGRKTINLKENDVLTIKKSKYKLHQLETRDKNFFYLLRTKLKWDLDL